MDPLGWLLIIPILLLLVLSAFFSSNETAYACLNKYPFVVASEKGDKKAKIVVSLYEKYDDTLVGVLLGYNICSIAASTIATFFFVRLFAGSLNDFAVSLISSIVMALLAFVIGDSIPKVIARKNPEAIVLRFVYLLKAVLTLFFPLSWIFRKITILLSLVFKRNPPPQITEEDFTNVVEHIEDKGELEENESDIIQASFDFTETTVKEVLTSKSKMFMVDLDGLTNKKLLDLVEKTSFSRIPLYYKEKDNVVGVLVVKNFLNEYLKDNSVSIRKIMQKLQMLEAW